jgi:hypothetical protein
MTDTQKWQIDLDNFILSSSKSPSGKIINVIKDGKLINVIVRKRNQRDDKTITLLANGVCTEGSGSSLTKFTCKPIDIFNKFNLNKDEIKVFNTIDEIQNKIQDQLDLKHQNLTNYKLLCAAQKTRLKDFYKQEVLREKDKFTNIIEALKNKVNISNMKQSNYEEKLLLSEDQKNALKEELSVMSRQQPIFSDIQNTSNKSNITRKQDEKLIKQQKDDFNLLKQELMNKQKMDTMEQQKKFNEQIMLNEKNMKKIQDSKLKKQQENTITRSKQITSKQDLNVMKMKQDSLLKEQLRKNKQEMDSMKQQMKNKKEMDSMKQQMKNKQEMDSMKQQMKNNRESMLYHKKRVKQETDSTKKPTLFYSLFSPKSKEGLNILKKPIKKRVVKKKPIKKRVVKKKPTKKMVVKKKPANKKVRKNQVKVFNYTKKLTKTKEGKYRFFWYRNDRYKVKDTLPKLYIKNSKIQYKNGRKLKRVAGKNTEFGRRFFFFEKLNQQQKYKNRFGDRKVDRPKWREISRTKKENFETLQKGLAGGYQVRQVVEANFEGEGEYYRGVITKVHLGGSYDVSYNDGEKEEQVIAALIRLPQRAAVPPPPPRAAVGQDKSANESSRAAATTSAAAKQETNEKNPPPLPPRPSDPPPQAATTSASRKKKAASTQSNLRRGRAMRLPKKNQRKKFERIKDISNLEEKEEKLSKLLKELKENKNKCPDLSREKVSKYCRKKGVESETNIRICNEKVIKTCMKAVGNRQRRRSVLPADRRRRRAAVAARKKDVKIILRLLYILSKIKSKIKSKSPKQGKGQGNISNKDVKSIINLIRLLSNKREILEDFNKREILEDFNIDKFEKQTFNEIIRQIMMMTSKLGFDQDELKKLIEKLVKDGDIQSLYKILNRLLISL